VHNSQHREIVDRWFTDLFTRGDFAAVDELVSANFVAHGQGGNPDSHSREAFRIWLRWYLSAFADPEWTVHDIITEGDKAVARYSGWTTYRGGLLDIPAANQRVQESGILIFRIANGEVQELWSEMSDLQVVMQLGAFPRIDATGTREDEKYKVATEQRKTLIDHLLNGPDLTELDLKRDDSPMRDVALEEDSPSLREGTEN
jgi:predicted ester cyclase